MTLILAMLGLPSETFRVEHDDVVVGDGSGERATGRGVGRHLEPVGCLNGPHVAVVSSQRRHMDSLCLSEEFELAFFSAAALSFPSWIWIGCLPRRITARAPKRSGAWRSVRAPKQYATNCWNWPSGMSGLPSTLTTNGSCHHPRRCRVNPCAVRADSSCGWSLSYGSASGLQSVLR
jgi:hypothetical protein